MRNFRKAIATLSVVAILSSLVVSTTAFAGTFNDVPADGYFYDAVETLVDLGIVDGARDNYDPARGLQRDEAAKLIVESAGLPADVPAEGHFMDVPTTLWSYEPVETAYAHSVVNGYSDADGNLTGYFGPADTVTRAQFAKMVVEAFDIPECVPGTPTFDDVSDTGTWYYTYVETAACNGIVMGYANGMFGANDVINRADGAVMIFRALDPTTLPPLPPEEVGDVNLSLGDTPASSVVPQGATRVPFLVMDADGMGTLNSMTFERFGAGSPGDFVNVYLYDGDTRLTTGRTINSSTHRVTFTGLNYDVDGSHELTLVADMANSGASNVDGFRLYDVTSSDNVSWGSVEGNLMSISSASVGKITIERTGTNPLTAPKVAEKDVKVAEFKLEAGSSEMVDVYGITLYQVGSLSRNDLTNFVLTQGGVEVASVSEVNSNDNIVLVFDAPYAMDKGDSRTFELWADIGSGARNDDTIKIYLDNAADLNAIGSTYGYGVQVTRDLYDNGDPAGAEGSWTTVEGGQVTISFMGPSVQDYATNSKDVELMRFNIISQNDVEVRNTRLKLTGTTDANAGLWNDAGASANYTDIKVMDVDSGTVLAGPFDIESSASGTDIFSKVLTDVWNLEAGVDRVLAVTADVSNFTPTASETVKVELVQFQGSDIKNLENNQYVLTTNIVPSATVQGNLHNIKTGSSSFSLSGTPSVQTYIDGSKNLEMSGAILRAGEGKDIFLKSLTVEATGTNECATETDCILTVSLWDGATQLGQTKSLSTTKATFNSLNLKVTKGSSKTLVVKTDLNTVNTVAGFNLKFNVTAATVQDMDGNTVSVMGMPVAGPNHTISKKGELFLAASPVESGVTDSRIVVAGTTLETLAKFKFTAQNEPLKLAKVPVAIHKAATIGTPVGDRLEISNEVNALYLYDGATLVAGPVSPDADGIARFTSFAQDFIIAKDTSKTLTVKADLNTITAGARSGRSLYAILLDSSVAIPVARDVDGDDTCGSSACTTVAVDGGDVVTTQFEARGINTNTLISTTGVAAHSPGRQLVVRKTKMLINKVNTSGVLTNNATNTIYEFTVAANAANNVAIKQLKFNLAVTDNIGTNNTLGLSNLKLYRNGDLIQVGEILITDAAGLITFGEGASTIVVKFKDEESITAGTTNTYRLEAYASGFANSDDDDSITVSLASDTAAQGATELSLVEDGNAIVQLLGGADYNIIWSDNSVVNHKFDAATPDSSTDWINSYLLKSLPLGNSSMNN